RQQVGHASGLAEAPVLRGDDDRLREALALDGLEDELLRLRTHQHVDALAVGQELLAQEMHRRGAVSLRDEQARRELRRVCERLAERPDHVEELMCLDLREPTRPATTTWIENKPRVPAHPPRRDAWWIEKWRRSRKVRPWGIATETNCPGRTRSATSGATIVIEWYAPTRLAFRTSARTRLTVRPREPRGSGRHPGGV